MLFDSASCARYATDASIYQILPIGAFVPRVEEDISIAIAIARDLKIPLLPRGAGTSQCGQTVGAALVIDGTKHLRQVLDIDAGRRTALVQPGLKVRGREYLRIIYGPDYTEPANLAQLRQRAVGHKRSLALREYALGLEALDRVAGGEPLWRVHECVFAVLALESEPVDPRL